MKTYAAIIAVVLAALPGCRKADHRSEASGSKDPTAKVLTQITFEVDHPEDKSRGSSPYVNLAQPEKDLKQMRNPDEVVFTGTNLIIVLDYPLRKEANFPISASSPRGFTRSELARKVAELYKRIYEEEERTSKIAVIPLEQRKGLINRNETNGKYGIWGHDLGDLVLHTIEISREAHGTILAYLGIDS